MHLLLLGAVSTAILIWSQHFADTLLRRRALGHRLSLGLRLAAHTVGAVLVMTGMVVDAFGLVLAGGILVGLNAVAHAVVIVGQSRGALPARFSPLVRYYAASALMLAVGVTLGVLMARLDGGGEDYERLFLGHLGLNLLGWVGLAVIGTIALLWPTVLHTRIEAATAAAGPTLPVLVSGLGLLALGCLADLRLVVTLGVLVYLVALGRVLREAVGHLRRAPAVTFAGWSLGAALVWFALCTLGFAVQVALAPSWTVAAARVEALVPYLAVGFAAQVLLGALSYLVPVVLGGGPAASKATAAELDRGGLFRVVTVNAALARLAAAREQQPDGGAVAAGRGLHGQLPGALRPRPAHQPAGPRPPARPRGPRRASPRPRGARDRPDPRGRGRRAAHGDRGHRRRSPVRRRR